MGPDLPLRILFVLPYPPNRIRTRSFHLLRALVAEGHKITLATLSKCETELHEVDDLADRLDSLIVEQLGSWRSLWNSLRAMPTSQPIQSAYSWSPRFANKLLQVVKEKQFDIIHVEHLRAARYGSMLASFLSRHSDREIPVVWDSVDCISGLFHQAAQQSHTFRARFVTAFELPRTQFYEAGLVRQFDRVLVTSEADREELLTLAEQKCRKAAKPAQSILAKKVVVVPNGVDLQYFVPGEMKRRPRTLVISGKMSYHANVTAVVHFVRNVMPLVWESLPDTQLWVVGKDPTSEIQRLGISWRENPKTPTTQESAKSRIRITGEVEDIRPYLWSASIAVAPIQYGAGIQNKVLEAMACGIPVVATPQAVRALHVRKGQELLVAHGHQEMAHSIVSLLGDSRRRAMLGRKGRIYVEKHHDWHHTAQTVTSIYRDTAQGLKTSRFVTSKAKNPIIPFKATVSISTQE